MRLLIVLVYLIFPLAAEAQNFWESVRVSQSPWYVQNIAVDRQGNIFAVSYGINEPVLVSRDDGVNWDRSSDGIVGEGIYFLATDLEDRVFTATDSGLFRSTDHGLKWHQIADRYHRFSSMAFGKNDELLAVGIRDSIYLSSDHGDTWMALGGGLDRVGFSKVAIAPSGSIFAGYPGEYGIYRSQDGGHSWVEKDAGTNYISVCDLLCDKYGDILAAGDGVVYISRDDGETWSDVGINDSWSMCLATDSAGGLYAGGAYGINVSKDHGRTWNNPTPDLYPAPFAIAICANGHIFAGTYYEIARSTNAGRAWNPVCWAPNTLRPITTGSNGDLFAGTWPDGLQISTDNGDTWVHSAIRTTSGGTSVTSLVFGLGRKLFAQCSSALIESASNGLYCSSDTGLTWRPLPGSRLAGVAFNRTSLVITQQGMLYLSTDSSIIYSADTGNTWNLADSCGLNHIVALAADSSGTIYAAGSYFSRSIHGRDTIVDHSIKVIQSLNRGKTWNVIGQNLLNDPLSIAIDDSNKTIFVGTSSGLYRSIGGSDWTAFDSLERDITAIIVSSPGNIFVGTSGGVVHSSDGGASWINVNSGLLDLDIGGLTINSAGRLFVSTNKGLFRSTLFGSNVIQYSRSSRLFPDVYPDPFSLSSTIRFSFSAPFFLTLSIYDLTGREVSHVARGMFSEGEHSILFDRGALPAGTYFYRLSTSNAAEQATGSFVIE